MNRLLVLVMCFFLAGCAGLAAGTYGKHEIGKTEFGLRPERNEFSFSVETYSPDQVIVLWGEPDEKQTRGICTVFGYENGTSWSGGGVFVGIVPVPLVVPSGNYWNYIYFKDQKSVGAVVEYGEVKDAVGVTCGSNECGGIAGDAGNSPEMSASEFVAEWCDVAA